MIRNGQGWEERKIRTGTRPVWPWSAPEPVKADTTPTLTFDMPAGAQAAALTRCRPDDTVNGLGGGTTNDRTRLTASGGGLAVLHRGLAGVDYGAAFLIPRLDPWSAVQVQRIEAGAIVLSKPLPAGVIISADYPATIQWATWTTADGAGGSTVPAAVSAAQTYETPIPWRVDYTGWGGADVPDAPLQRVEGFAHVVDRMFQTGLTHARFDVVSAGFNVGGVWRQLADWTPLIDHAFLRLVRMIREAVSAGGRRAEDDLDGAALLDVHVHLTAALAMAGDPAEYKRHMEEAQGLFKVALHRLVADPNENGGQVTNQGRQGSDLVGGSFTGDETRSRTRMRVGQGW